MNASNILQGGKELTDYQIDFIKCNSNPDRDHYSDELKASVILRDVQTHYWHHTPSRFKVTKRTPKALVCRFFKPVDANQDAAFYDHFYLVIHRPIGSEYVNSYKTITLKLLRCNHDIRLVMECGSKDVVSYMCKYVMKPQNPIENSIAYSLAAFKKATRSLEARQTSRDMTQRQRGNKILTSMLYSMINKQDIAASIAALYIYRCFPFWFSHEVVRANISQLFHAFEDLIDVKRRHSSVSRYFESSTIGYQTRFNFFG